MGRGAAHGAADAGDCHGILRPLYPGKRPAIRNQCRYFGRGAPLGVRIVQPALRTDGCPAGVYPRGAEAACRAVIVQTGRFLLPAVCGRLLHLHDSVGGKRRPAAAPAGQGHQERLCQRVFCRFAWLYHRHGQRDLGGENGHHPAGGVRQRGTRLLLPHPVRCGAQREFLSHRLRKSGGRHCKAGLRSGKSRGRWRPGAPFLPGLPQACAADIDPGTLHAGNPAGDVRPEPAAGKIQNLRGRRRKPGTHPGKRLRPLCLVPESVLHLRLRKPAHGGFALRQRSQGHHLRPCAALRDIPAGAHRAAAPGHLHHRNAGQRGTGICSRPFNGHIQRPANQAHIVRQPASGCGLAKHRLFRCAHHLGERPGHRLAGRPAGRGVPEGIGL